MTKMSSEPTHSLTQKEKAVLQFIEDFIQDNALAPSFTEIQNHFGFASINSVQRYVKQLESKGYLQKGEPNQKRSIVLLKTSNDFLNELYDSPSLTTPSAVDLPLLGKVAAGLPLEEKTFDEHVSVPLSLVPKPSESFVLRIQGDSMVDEGIFNGDLVVIEKRAFAANGNLVVASTEDESATVKRIYYHNGQVELRPSNQSMNSFWYEPHKINLQGLVVGLIRQY